MARIALTTWGSHGDVDPFLGLALGLRARGHDVTIATLEYFRSLVTGQGIRFHPIRPEVNPTDADIVRQIMDGRRGTEFLLRQLIFPAVEAMYEDLCGVLEGVDLVVSHPLTMAAPIYAQQRGLAWASVVLAPMSFFSRYDVPVLPPAPWLKSLERYARWPGTLIVSLGKSATGRWPTQIYALRQRLGLPKGANPVFDGQHSPRLVLAMYSRVLGAPQADWPPNVEVTGHMFHDAPHGAGLSAEVEAFLDAGPAPVVFTLGSSAVLVAGDFWRESIEAVRQLGCRAIMLVGPGNIESIRALLPPELLPSRESAPRVMVIEGAPHSWLMPRASVVVQQCGIGTMSQSLRSGRPMLAVPHAHDQPDNAYRAAQLGMARQIYPSRYRARRVASELRRLQDDPSYVAAAQRTAAVVRSERGVEAACDALEERFDLR